MNIIAQAQTSSSDGGPKDSNCTASNSTFGKFQGFVSDFTAVVTPAPNGSGFNLSDSEACKPQAQLAQESVVRMVLPSTEMRSIRELIGNDGLQTRIDLLKRIQEGGAPPPSTDDINSWQIEKCIKLKSKECFLSTAYRSSTVVLTGDGTTSSTVFHNLKLFLRPFLRKAKLQGFTAKETAALLRRMPIPAFFYNYRGELIAEPTNLSVRIKEISAEQIAEAWQNLNMKDMPTFLDKTALSFSRKLGKGVPIAKNPPTVGEFTAIFGYPGATNKWRQMGSTDSNGHSLYCTVGPVISAETAAHQMEWGFTQLSEAEQNLYRSKATFTAAASFGGMSGGAVFNSTGELVAVHSSGSNNPFTPATSNTLVIGK